ncbi:MAG TPA: DUF1566 domain-containing protein [Polyangiales bacterium]|nr:DUF1566 domain-containing protein [Polyangiales bacterium]
MDRATKHSCAAALALLLTYAPAAADAPEGQYTVHENIVEDNRTGLTWQRQVEVESFTWEEAKSYCELLTLDGRGWRLPAYKELLTIVDPTVSSPAIDGKAFPSTPRAWFWTASSYLGIAGNAWQVFFLDGTTVDVESTKTNRVRCVR